MFMTVLARQQNQIGIITDAEGDIRFAMSHPSKEYFVTDVGGAIEENDGDVEFIDINPETWDIQVKVNKEVQIWSYKTVRTR